MKRHLYDSFAERWYRGGSIWLYSDPHFGDEEMKSIRKNYIGDEEQIKRLNSKIGRNDTIIFLGDIGDLECVKRIRGYKILIMGNHEKGASNYKRVINKITTFNSEELSDEDRARLVANAGLIMKDPQKFMALADIDQYFHQRVEDNHLFDEVYEGALMISDKIILSHEPIEALPPFLLNIHGHDHASWYRKDNQHINLCAEHINYTPVNLKHIIENGWLKNIKSIHRIAIDKQIQHKKGIR